MLLFLFGLYPVAILLSFKQTEYNLVSPWIEEGVICEVFSQYVDNGLIMGAIFLVMLYLKIHQKNAWVFGIGVVTMVGNWLVNLLSYL